jgi:two-component system sensor kinase FixL
MESMTLSMAAAEAIQGGGEALTAEDFRQTLHEVGVCIWSLDISTGRVSASQTCGCLFGIPTERLTSFAATQDLVHPDDRQARAHAIESVLRDGGSYEIEYRVVLPNGRGGWLRSRGQVQLDAEGRPHRHRGVVFSIEE